MDIMQRLRFAPDNLQTGQRQKEGPGARSCGVASRCHARLPMRASRLGFLYPRKSPILDTIGKGEEARPF
jgi:hypothetical protein